MIQGTKKITRELVSDEEGAKLSLNRLISIVAAAVLSFAFIKNMLLGYELSWDLMLGYAVSMAMCATPTLAGKFLGLRYGHANGKEPPAPGAV